MKLTESSAPDTPRVDPVGLDPALLRPLDPPARLLMGPGPIDADPRVLRAMSAPLVGQYDPFMTAAMGDVQELYRHVFRTSNEATLLVDGTARAGIEAVLVSLLRPGDDVLVPIFGRFGHLLAEIAERCGAVVHRVEAEWGRVLTLDQLGAALARVRPKLLALVHADTSTTMAQPFEGVAELCERHGALLYADVTASIAGNSFEMDALGVDAATAGLQKCLGGPSGSAPTSLSERAVAVIDSRRSTEAGIAIGAEEVADAAARVRSNYFDLGMILDYWGPRRLNHHTEATTMLYAAHECARIVLEEGLDAVIERHRVHGAAMVTGLRELGLQTFGDDAHRMNNVVAVEIPEGIDGTRGESVRGRMLTDHGIEIGTSFGPLAGRVWRIGTMGYNARREPVLTTLAALGSVLAGLGARRADGGLFDPGSGVAAAREALS